ncbi:MAG: hypothetical protein MJ179_04070 [Treponema sp.]|nr:hypothetical protein [Treponema sp.]
MAVSQKKRPSIPNISSSLNMITSEPEDFQQAPVEIETVAPVQQHYTSLADEKQAFTAPQKAVAVKKSTKDTQIIFRTTEDNKNSLKGFFATYGITLSKGIQLACFYLEQQIKAGSVEINSAGLITKQERR